MRRRNGESSTRYTLDTDLEIEYCCLPYKSPKTQNNGSYSTNSKVTFRIGTIHSVLAAAKILDSKLELNGLEANGETIGKAFIYFNFKCSTKTTESH